MASLVPSSQERAEGHLLSDKGNGELVGGRERAKMTQPVLLSSARAAPCKGCQSFVCVRVIQRWQEDAGSEGGLYQERGQGEEYGILSRSSRPQFFLSMLYSSPLSPPHPQKASCERDARYAAGYDKVKDTSEVVTPRFLCTGGVSPYADPNTCKGKRRLFGRAACS